MYGVNTERVNFKSRVEREEVETFLQGFNLILDQDVDYTIFIRDGASHGASIVATCSKAKSVLKCIDFEETHSLGLCLDIDEYDRSGYRISWQELGYQRRKYYLCEDYAHHCVRSRHHNEYDIITYIEENIGEYRERVYGR